MEDLMTVDIAPATAPGPRNVAQSFSLEATRPSADEVARLADTVPPGTMVYVTAVPQQSVAEQVRSAACLRRAGLEPVAHIAARRLASLDQMHDLLRGLRDEADTRRLLVIGGDVDKTGPLPDALAVIRQGNLRGLGFEEIGVGGYPEPHPRIAPGRLAAALDEKIALAVAQGLRIHIASQFSFSPDSILAWLRQLRGCGMAWPVRVGLVGPTSVPGLLRFARRCGVNASLRGLVSGAATGLVGHVGPGRIIDALSMAEDLGEIALHYFSFGGTVETARYACEAAAGRHDVHRAMAHPN
jgi:methylenetetrahydrofolate reductase (NADPH)